MTGFRPRLWPTVLTVPAFLILVGLGLWQVDRLHWKEGLIAARSAAVAAAPVAAPRTAAAAAALDFHPIVAEGRFLHDREILVHAISPGGEAGYRVYTPLVAADGRAVFVDRGFVPAELADPARRAAGETGGIVTVHGLLRLPYAARPNLFVPENRPGRGQWFWPDLPAMTAAAGLAQAAPYTIEADATPNPGGWPRGGVTDVALPNHHLQYAITWFSLAVALLVIYVLSQRGNADRA